MQTYPRRVSIDELIEIIKNSPQYRALHNKTQIIFVDADNPETSHILTRQTHTEAVAEISSRLAQELGLDEKLAELIGLCHDLGHTPFGHDGESVLNRIAMKFGFKSSDLQKLYNQMNPGNTFSIDSIRNGLSDNQPKESDSAFEHHHHSLRVFNDILSSNNITIDDYLRKYILTGILSHSESRETFPKEKYAQIPRIADKFYAFTDLNDIVNCGIKIDVRAFFADMKSKQCLPVVDKETKGTTLEEPSEEDLLELEKIVSDAESRDDFLDVYRKKYIDDIMSTSKGSDKIDVSDKTRKTMGHLKALAKYMRQEMIIEKEEGLAQRMVNEVWAYVNDKINVSKYCPDGTGASKELLSLFLVARLSDNDIIKMYKSISKNKDWLARIDSGEIALDAVDEKKQCSEDQVKLLRQRPEIVRYMDIDNEYQKLCSLCEKGEMPSETAARIERLGASFEEYSQNPQSVERLQIKFDILDIKDSLSKEKSPDVCRLNKDPESQGKTEP